MLRKTVKTTSSLLSPLPASRPLLRNFNRSNQANARSVVTTAAAQKPEGDISNAFASLSGMQFGPLDSKFAELKTRLIQGNEEALCRSWRRLLRSLREEVPLIKAKGPEIIPEIDFNSLDDVSQSFHAEHKKRGVAIIRNVIPEQEVLNFKQEVKDYLRTNPQTKAFPADNPQVFELYWSPPQIKARSHPNLLKAQKFLMSFWHSKDPQALISSAHPIIYADRLRMRLPGDASFALGPHVDGGSCERWEEGGYGRGKVYDAIFKGKWESYDPWESSCRLPAVVDLYGGVGACSAFRMFQGWLAMSDTGPREGTLLVNPLLGHATAYFLLRPFFSPKRGRETLDPLLDETFDEEFLAPENWVLDSNPNPWLHGATPGHGQELRPFLHPHLDLPNTMVHVPRVRPGDYVSWHCDTVHAVDQVHRGESDSSVMYIPSCPLTVGNAEFLARQRRSFLDGTPSPDFGGGRGESEHVGRSGVEDVRKVNPVEGMRAFGLMEWDRAEKGLTPGQNELMDRVNKILGF